MMSDDREVRRLWAALGTLRRELLRRIDEVEKASSSSEGAVCLSPSPSQKAATPPEAGAFAGGARKT